MTVTLPSPRTPDPLLAPPLRWGIVAPGFIATEFAIAARLHTSQRLLAVASRSPERAAEFAVAHRVEKVHASYQDLYEDPEVDAVYVASPHSEHLGQALAALEAGKHVLVEKAFARSASEAKELVAAARAAGVTLMEAMWTRFLPRTDIVRQLLADGALGEIESLRADHGQPLTHVHRLMDPSLAGGALLDLGIYPVSYAWFVLGRPGRVEATGTLTGTGVDRQVAITLSGFADHPNAVAQLSTTLAARTPTTLDINGPLGRIELDGDFYVPGQVRVVSPDGTAVTSPRPVIGAHRGMCHEVAHFAQLVADGRSESPLLPLAETLAIMETLDEIRGRLQVVYPGE